MRCLPERSAKANRSAASEAGHRFECFCRWRNWRDY